MIDTHCHLTYDGLHERIDEVLHGAAAAGVTSMITVGTTPDDARRAIALAARFPNVYASVGLHPHYTPDWSDEQQTTQILRELAAHPRVVALGEMGLDRYYPDPPLDVQRRAFGWQLALMRELDHLPGIIHNRQATDDTLAMLRDSGVAPQRWVFHCFTGSASELDAILAFGAMVSFTGIVTFKSAQDIAAASDRVPLDRMMIETDSPYLAPEPHRKVRPNEPKYVAHIAAFLAQRRGMSVEAFIATMDANSQRFFRLPR